MKLIRVKGNYNGITLESGKLLFKDIANGFIDGEDVHVDFVNQEYLSAVFLCSSIGYLFSLFKEDVIDNLTIQGTTEKQDMIIERILNNSSKYYNDAKHRDALDAAISKLAEELSGE